MKSSLVVAILLSIFAMLSCAKEQSKKATHLIEKALNQKIESFKLNKRQECFESIFTDAEVLVDSIIAQQLNLDTIDFPNKPIKPNSPNIKDIPEEFELAPIKLVKEKGVEVLRLSQK